MDSCGTHRRGSLSDGELSASIIEHGRKLLLLPGAFYEEREEEFYAGIGGARRVELVQNPSRAYLIDLSDPVFGLRWESLDLLGEAPRTLHGAYCGTFSGADLGGEGGNDTGSVASAAPNETGTEHPPPVRAVVCFGGGDHLAVHNSVSHLDLSELTGGSGSSSTAAESSQSWVGSARWSSLPCGPTASASLYTPPGFADAGEEEEEEVEGSASSASSAPEGPEEPTSLKESSQEDGSAAAPSASTNESLPPSPRYALGGSLY